MLVRSAASAFRTTPRAALHQPLRRHASTSPTAEKKSYNTLFLALTGAAVAGGAYYYYFVSSKPLPPAVPTLTSNDAWVPLTLESSHKESPTTALLRFRLPSENHVTGLPIASAILTKYKPEGAEKLVLRPYTPVSDENKRGYMDLLVKRYEGGPMSTHLHSLKPGDALEVKGPLPKYPWVPSKHGHVTMIAGGTGITPMFQVARRIFSNPKDKTKVTLIFGNVSEEEILLRKEWAKLENTYPQRLKVVYVLDKAPKEVGWAHNGRVTKELLKQLLPEPGSGNNMIFVCGPPGMYKAISGMKKSPTDQGELQGMLRELGYKKDEVYKF